MLCELINLTASIWAYVEISFSEEYNTKNDQTVEQRLNLQHTHSMRPTVEFQYWPNEFSFYGIRLNFQNRKSIETKID